MSDDRPGRQADDWPPAVPSGIRLRPRSVASPAPVARPAPAPAPLVAPLPVPEPAPLPVARPAPAAAPLPSTAGPAPARATSTSASATSPPDPSATAHALIAAHEPTGPLLDPAGYRIRLVRDTAAALAVVVGIVVVGSLVARPEPDGAVLSATSAPGDPRGAPALLVPERSPSDAPGASPGGTAGPSPAPGSSTTAVP